MKYLLIATLVILSASITGFAQGARVRLKTGIIKDIQIKATSDDALYIDGGTIRNVDIDTIIFHSQEDPKYKALYTKLQKSAVVLFAGADAPKIADDGIILEYNDGFPQFQKVIEIPGKTASDLYTMSNRWIAVTYNNPGEVIQSTLENEMIRGTGIGNMKLSELPPTYCKLLYVFKIDVKDGKVRFTMYDMYALTPSVGKMPVSSYIYKKDGTMRATGQARAVSTSITNTAAILMLSLKRELSSDYKKDDW